MKKWTLSLSFLGVFIALLAGSYLIGPQKTAEAACGASTSSCQTCHEDKGEAPVSKNGDWHVQHAFGDFCQACHLGDSTAEEKSAAHEGMILKPLSQPNQSCATCHPSDLEVRVTKYSGTSSATSTKAASSEGQSSEQSAPSSAASPWLSWIIGIADVIILFVLVALILKWKKGFWIWRR